VARRSMGDRPRVAILMGSDSDLIRMARCVQVLDGYGIAYEVRVLSAHRTPQDTVRFARSAERRGIKLIIAGAGGAAHLAGVLAAHVTLPVIGVPLDSSPLAGLDALLSTVQMPPGIPVATVGVGTMGAANAGHLAAAILGLTDPRLRLRLRDMRRSMAVDVRSKSKGLNRRLRALLEKP
jgi:phosphoribosylaminoimidazole carboxylase PurE protein